jgi:hypothetical protein
MGHPKTGGRKVGSVNKATAEVRAAAQVYTNEALKGLVRLMRGLNVKGKTRSEVLPQTQFCAMQEILNSGYGRPATAVTGEGGEGPVTVNLTVVDEFYP